MIAWPFLPGRRVMKSVCAPAFCSISARNSPSSPILPACQVSMPLLARATDWLSPFPPANIAMLCEDMVSVLLTKCSTLYTKSIFNDPKFNAFTSTALQNNICFLRKMRYCIFSVLYDSYSMIIYFSTGILP